MSECEHTEINRYHDRSYGDFWMCRECEARFVPASQLGTLQWQIKNLAEHNALALQERNEARSRLDALQTNLREAYELLNDAVAEHDHHVDVSAACVWLAANEGVVEKGQTDEKGRPMTYWGGEVEKRATEWPPEMEAAYANYKPPGYCAGCDDRNLGKPFSWDRPHVCADYLDESEREA